jgi:DNA-binding NarL/FixJ family response regulator
MRIIVAADSPVVRAGLKVLVEDSAASTIIGCMSSRDLMDRARELQPDVILWQLLPGEGIGAVIRGLSGFKIILLSSNAALDFIRSGAYGVLPLNASADQISVAIEAAGAGLGVFPPEHLDTYVEPAAPSILTARETEVLRMIAEGLANKEIAFRLGISDHTVKFHVSALLGKLGVSSRAEAIGAGIRQGVIML